MAAAFHCKVFLVIWGALVVAGAWHTHFESAWVKDKYYKICSDKSISLRNCPSVDLEKFFLVAVILALFWSMMVLLISKLRRREIDSVVNLDIGYHVVAGLVVFAGSVFYLFSEESIDNLSLPPNRSLGFNTPQARKELLRTEKIMAAVLGIVESLAYGVTAIVLHQSVYLSKNKRPDCVIQNPITVKIPDESRMKGEVNTITTNIAYQKF